MNAEKDKQLIALVKDFPCLYNHSVKEYRNKHARNDAWTKISQVLKIPVVKCSKHWSALRSAFLHALVRRRYCYRPIPSWRYEREMEFLVPFLYHKTITPFCSMDSKLNSTHAFVAKSDDESSYEDEKIDAKKIKIEQVDPTETQLPDLNVKHNGKIITANTPTQNSAFGMNLKVEFDEQNKLDEIRVVQVKEEPLDVNEDIVEENYENEQLETEKKFQVNDSTLSVKDDIDLFFESLAKSVKKLPREEQIKIKLNFISTLSEIELKLMLSKSNC